MADQQLHIDQTADLIAQLSDPNYLERTVAAFRLTRRIEEPGVIEALAPMLLDPEVEVRNMALNGLFNTQDVPEVRAVINQALVHEDYGIRISAYNLLPQSEQVKLPDPYVEWYAQNDEMRQMVKEIQASKASENKSGRRKAR